MKKRRGFAPLIIIIIIIIVVVIIALATSAPSNVCFHDCGPTTSPLQIKDVQVTQTGASITVFNPTVSSFDKVVGGVWVCIPASGTFGSYGNCRDVTAPSLETSPGSAEALGAAFSMGPLASVTFQVPFSSALPHGTYAVQVSVFDGVNGNPAFKAMLVTV